MLANRQEHAQARNWGPPLPSRARLCRCGAALAVFTLGSAMAAPPAWAKGTPRPRRLWLGYARNVERLTRDTFGPTGSFAVSLRSQWFATGDLLHMTLLGGSMRQRASGCGDDFGGG